MSWERIVSSAWRDFTGAWPKLLLTALVYKLIAFVLLTPLVGLALRGFMALKGQSVLADQDILFFVLSPVGIVTLVVVATATLAILAVEQAALMTIGFGSIRDKSVGVRESLVVGFRHLGPILDIAARVVGRVLLLAAPFLGAAGLVYWLLLTEFDINFYLSNRPPVFFVAAALIGTIVLVLVFVAVPRLASWSYALPLHLFEDVPARRAIAESAERTRGQRSTVISVVAGWALFSILLASVGLGVVTTLGRLFVPLLQHTVTPLVVVMGALLLLWYVVNLLITALQASGFALLVLRLYDRHESSKTAVLPSEAAAPGAEAARPGFGLRSILAGIAAATLLAGGLGYYLLHTVRTDDDVIVIAHRGAAGRAPENTMASFAAAMDDRADLVEMDVQETKDGIVVVIHDSDFMKIANEPVKVWEGNLDELRAFDIGSWFSPEFSSERLPKLEEVLALAKRRDAHIDIELKFYGHNQRLEERVVELVEAAGMASNVVLMSLRAEMVQKIRSLRPSWTVGLLTATAVGDLTRADVDFLAVHVAMASPGFIRRAKSAGKDVYVWTVNDPINMSRLMSRGVDGLITDEPALARTVISERAGLGSLERLLLEASYWLGADTREPPPETDVN